MQKVWCDYHSICEHVQSLLTLPGGHQACRPSGPPTLCAEWTPAIPCGFLSSPSPEEKKEATMFLKNSDKLFTICSFLTSPPSENTHRHCLNDCVIMPSLDLAHHKILRFWVHEKQPTATTPTAQQLYCLSWREREGQDQVPVLVCSLVLVCTEFKVDKK